MLELASLGAKVLQVRSVELGMVHKVRIFVRSSFDEPEDIDPHGTPPGTLICDEEEIVEQQVVTGIAFSKDEAQITLRHVPDKPGVAAAIFGPLADANINVDMIMQNVSDDGATTDLTFTVPAADYERAARVLDEGASSAIGYERARRRDRRRQGLGDRHRHAQPCRRRRAGLQGAGRHAASTSAPSPPRRSSSRVLIDAAYTELAVRTLHSLYGLDKRHRREPSPLRAYAAGGASSKRRHARA